MTPQPATDARDLPAVERPPSLAEHVRRVLRADVTSGSFLPGERLTEAMVMARTGVSRTPAREGLRLLEAEGLVLSHRGRGASVAYRLSAEEAAIIYDCRLRIEPHLTRLACERMTPGALIRLRGLLERFQAAAEAGERGHTLGRLDSEFHVAVYEVSASQLLSVFRGYWAKLQIELSVLVYESEPPSSFFGEHDEILAALEGGQAARAAELMERHIGHGRSVLERALADR